MSFRPVKAVFFDLDGTLIDSEKMAAETLILEIEKLGMSWNYGDAEFITGRTWASAFTLLYSKYVFPIPIDEFSSRVLSAYRARLEREVKEVRGAASAVRSLAESIPLVLVSGSYRREVLIALNALKITECFQFILGAEDYTHSKPNPDGYNRGFALLKAGLPTLRPEECLVFEDSAAGIASGLAAGFRVVAITLTNHFNQKSAAAHFFLEDLGGVTPAWVSSLKSESTSG